MGEVRVALRQAREAKRLTVAQAAQLAGYKSKSGWSSVENGTNSPRLQQLIRMAQVVGKKPVDVFPELIEEGQAQKEAAGDG